MMGSNTLGPVVSLASMPKVKLFDEDDALDKAMALFWKQGYHATSMQDLVEHLNISRSSLYDTFDGKKALFDGTLERYCTTNRARIKKFLREQTSVKRGLKKLFAMAIAESVDDKDNKGCFVVNTTTELVPGDKKICKILTGNSLAFEQIFFEFLRSGVRSGEIPGDKDIAVIASLLHTLFSGIRVVAKVQPNKKKHMSSVNAVLSLLD